MIDRLAYALQLDSGQAGGDDLPTWSEPSLAALTLQKHLHNVAGTSRRAHDK